MNEAKKLPGVGKDDREKEKPPVIRRDWEELMGVSRDTYKRAPGGVIRRR